MMRALGLATLVAVLAATGCSEQPPRPPQRFAVRAFSDPGKPLAGARVLLGGKVVATSDASGIAAFALQGREGQTFEVAVRCPAGYQTRSQTLAVMLRRMRSPDSLTEYDAACPPRTRTIVVVVRGEAGYELPVLRLGREIARTDAAGVATVLLHVAPQDQFDLTLDTTGTHGALRPADPVATFVARDHDDVFVFDPRFTVTKKTPRRVVTRSRRPRAPIRIQ